MTLIKHHGQNIRLQLGVLVARIIQYLTLRHNAYLVGNVNLNQTLVTEIAEKGPFDVCGSRRCI